MNRTYVTFFSLVIGYVCLAFRTTQSNSRTTVNVQLKGQSKLANEPTPRSSHRTSKKKYGIPHNMEENLKHVAYSVRRAEPQILQGLATNGFVVIDNFLGNEVCALYRREAEGFYNRGDMSTSQSTRWDRDANAVVAYDKVNVKSAQLNGGDDYALAPRLHEYVVSFIQTIVPQLNTKFPSSMLSPTMASNKLGKYIWLTS